MRRNTIVTAVAALTFMGAVLGAQSTQAPPPQQKPPAKQQPATPPAKQQPTTPAAKAELTSTGKLTKYDPETRTVTIMTARGEEMFMLAQNATIREATKTLTAADVKGLVGREVTVGYTETAGRKNAVSLTVSATPAAKTPAAPTSKPPASTPPAKKPGN